MTELEGKVFGHSKSHFAENVKFGQFAATQMLEKLRDLLETNIERTGKLAQHNQRQIFLVAFHQ